MTVAVERKGRTDGEAIRPRSDVEAAAPPGARPVPGDVRRGSAVAEQDLDGQPDGGTARGAKGGEESGPADRRRPAHCTRGWRTPALVAEAGWERTLRRRGGRDRGSARDGDGAR